MVVSKLFHNFVRQMKRTMQVKVVIARHGFTQTQVADMIGTAKGNLSHAISKGPTPAMLHRIAKAIGADYDEFFEDEIIPSSTPEFAGEISIGGKRYGLIEL